MAMAARILRFLFIVLHLSVVVEMCLWLFPDRRLHNMVRVIVMASVIRVHWIISERFTPQEPKASCKP